MIPQNRLPTGRPPQSPARSNGWTVRQEKRPLKAMPMTRRYQACCLVPGQGIVDFNRLAPALPLFEEAFSAFARGTLVTTDCGPVAVEDLAPGMRVMTSESGPEPVLWIGSMTLYPSASTPDAERPGLIRITADALGMGRPAHDVVLGPGARLLYRNTRCQALVGTDAAYAPARALIDGVNVIDVAPMAAVTVYHLAFAQQRSVRAGGLEIESYVPGAGIREMAEPQMVQFFLTLFPHLKSIEDFGAPRHPRLTRTDLETLLAG